MDTIEFRPRGLRRRTVVIASAVASLALGAGGATAFGMYQAGPPAAPPVAGAVGSAADPTGRAAPPAASARHASNCIAAQDRSVGMSKADRFRQAYARHLEPMPPDAINGWLKQRFPDAPPH